ncbi:PREDICTED: uncharacterized protein LOC108377583 [Rhagoletis zephyria]|uniref:uncharacterized protein LOC108377583 n=1 Tax=Rhagoletis zephyria TaxID=28612 RepID=UPI0008116BE6|nr:PREDICTED: uncharacterized protein LOC108377583 [Rhagoletis zephyria]
MRTSNTRERRHEYMAHRLRVQNAKSVVNSQPPSRVVNQPRREMSFTEMMNSVRTAIQCSSNKRTFTNAPASTTPSATGTIWTVATTASNTSPRRPAKSHIKSTNSNALTNVSHDKSAMLLYDCNSCGLIGCCGTCGGAGDRRHCMVTCAHMHEKLKRKLSANKGDGDKCRVSCSSMPTFHDNVGFNSNIGFAPSINTNNVEPASRNSSENNKKVAPQPNTAEQRAAYQHARLSMPLRSFWHRIKRKEWNDDTRIPTPKPKRCSSETSKNQSKRSAQHSGLPEEPQDNGSSPAYKRASSAMQDDGSRRGIPPHVLKHYQAITVSTDESMLRRLLRPRVFFDLEVKGIRPLGRIVIQLFTEACPEVVLEFVRMCTMEGGERMRFTRLFPMLWLEGELALTDKKTLTAHNIEHDMNVLDHGSGAGVLSFPSRYVRGSKRRFLSFSISFKPLKLLNGKRIAFGRVRRGFWILDTVQDYGTNSGKPQRDIAVTNCGMCK